MKPRRDHRLTGLVITIAAVGILGGAITLMPDPQPQPVTTTGITAEPGIQNKSEQHATDARMREVEVRFQQAIAMLHGKQYDYAIKALHRVLELSPKLVEAHVNMGYALIGKEDYKAAYDFFQSATALKPEQVNAYYGMAVALEGMGELEGAVGAMRTYIHLSSKDDPFLTKARSALWEWEEQLTTQRQDEPQGDTETTTEQHG
jgi:tetratricopeptide (TPR) repeat protein